MGKSKVKARQKQLRALQRELEHEMTEAAVRLDALVVEAHERVERQLAELEVVSVRAHTATEDADTTLRGITETTVARLHELVEHVEAQRGAVDATRSEITANADDLAEQIRTQAARLDDAVDAGLARFDERARQATDEQLAAVTERASSRLDAAVEERLAALDAAHADALHRLEDRAAETERDLAEIRNHLTARAVETQPEPEPLAGLDVEMDVVEMDLEAEIALDEWPDTPTDVRSESSTDAPAESTPESTPELTVADLRWTAPQATCDADPDAVAVPFTSPVPDPDPALASMAPPTPAGVPVPEAAVPPPAPASPPTSAPTSSSASVPTATLLRSGPAVTFETSRTPLLTALAELRRAAADGWVRVEIVHRASQGHAVASLRLTVHDLFGGCEYHDVPGRVSSGLRQAILVDAAEMLQAVEVDESPDSSLSILLDGDVTIGRVLVLGRDAPGTDPAGDRRKIERIELPPGGVDSIQLDTLAGRFVVPSRIASSLRSRRARDIDLIMVGDQAWLSARVPGPTDEVTATIETPLLSDPAQVPESATDRRDLNDSAVDQLVRALSVGSSPEDLVTIVTRGVGYARRRAAAHPALPPDVIIAMLSDGTEAMRSAAASNPSVPPTAIELAVNDTAPAVRAAVAVNPRVPPARLFTLLRDDSAQVRLSAARNEALPPEMLAFLADDPDATVRASVAAHKSCPVEVLERLAGDPFAGVCGSVAANPNCPAETLEQLLSIVPEVALSNPHAPEHVLVAGSQVASPTLRAAVAANPSTPARELQVLARDPDRAVVRALAENPNAPSTVRRRARRRSERSRTSTRAAGPT